MTEKTAEGLLADNALTYIDDKCVSGPSELNTLVSCQKSGLIQYLFRYLRRSKETKRTFISTTPLDRDYSRF